MATQAAAPAANVANGTSYQPRYIDIGINLSDPIFRGKYHGSQKHPDDLDGVVDRARQVGCSKLIVTGSDFKSSRHALELAEEHNGTCYATVGIHPCSSAIFGDEAATKRHSEHSAPCDGGDPYAAMSEDHHPDPKQSADAIATLTNILAEARSAGHQHVVAMGEFGLDYDRLNFCNRTLQKHSFEAQLKVAASLQPQLPLFLHSRAAHEDFVAHLKAAFGDKLENLEKGGVVHSFTGTLEEMNELMDLGLYIGINGCSFKTAENCAVVKAVRLDRIMLETDGPWCEVRPSHEGYKYLIEKKAELAAAAVPLAAPLADSGVSSSAESAPNPGNKGKQQPKKSKNQKKEPEVPDRFKVVKKEKWEEGAMIKGRNEPCNIERVAAIVAAIKGVSVEEVCEAAWNNTVKVFGIE